MKLKKTTNNSIIILKTAEEAAAERIARKNRWRMEQVCPCCGYAKNFSAIEHTTSSFFGRTERRMLYRCDKCGAEWLGLPLE